MKKLKSFLLKLIFVKVEEKNSKVMKMEILAVQNEFMHVMPSTKPKNGTQWTSRVQSAPKKAAKEVAVEALEDEDEFSFLQHLPQFNDSEVEHVQNVLMATLRDAKQRHLSATEVLLPCDILQRITLDMLRASDSEACGIRGANIRIEFEDEEGERRVIATTNTDHHTVATFELCLTLKHAHSRSKWISAIMPQFLRNLTKATTIVISRDYELRKEKLSCYEFAE